MPMEIKFTFDTPDEVAKWSRVLAVLALEGKAAPAGVTSAPEGHLVPAKGEPPKVVAKADPYDFITLKSGKVLSAATGVEILKELKEAGWGPSLAALKLAELRELFAAYASNDEFVLAKYPKASAPAEEKPKEEKPKYPPPAAPAAPAKPAAKKTPAPAAPAAPAKKKKAAQVTEDEEVEPAAPKVVERAPLPKKSSASNALGRQTPDSFPGALDEDPDEEPMEEEMEEEVEEEVEEAEELEELDDGEEEIEEAPPVNVPKIARSKVPTDLLAADRMRSIIAVIQRTHGVKAPADIYRYMLAYAQHVPKIQQHLDAEGSEERMVNRITNIVAAMTPGR